MASFIFETGNQTNASGFVSGDQLVFQSDLAQNLTFTEGTAQFGTSTLTISDGTQSLQFAQGALANSTMTFLASGSGALAFGSSAANTVTLNNTISNTYFGFEGADTITASGAGSANVHGGADGDTITLSGTGIYSAWGDAGADTIVGSAGNDHLYGGAAGAVQGTVDGTDSLDGGAGNDYLQGNAGADTLLGGTGSDRIFGGADGDSILGGAGNDTVNGNRGADFISGEAGNDYLRGGQDSDTLSGGSGDDILKGDAGSDTLIGGTGVDVLEGGTGAADRFQFAAGDATYTTDSTSGVANPIDLITDYETGSDKLAIGFVPAASGNVIHGGTGVTFSTVAAAETYAQGLLNAAGTTAANVAAITVGSDTYLFFHGAGGTGTGSNAIDSAIHIANVVDTAISNTDFVA